MSFRFKPEDFEGMRGHYQKEQQEQWCERANQLLDAHIATLPEVFQAEHGMNWWDRDEVNPPGRRARLWDVEEIAPKKCEHFNLAHSDDSLYLRMDFEGYLLGKCNDCGRKLKAKWEEA